MKRIYRRLIVAVGGLAVVLVSLVFLQNQYLIKPTLPQHISVTPTPQIVDTTLSFYPNVLSISHEASASAHTADVVLTSSENVTNIQIELVYNPQIITILSQKLSEDSGLTNKNASVSVNSIDSSQGRASFIVLIPSGQKAINGKFMHVSFLAKRSIATSSAEIAFLPKTFVSDNSSDSILKSTQNLKIIFQ